MAPRRNLLRTIGLFLVVGAIILTFVLFFGQPAPQASVGPVAEIDGVTTESEGSDMDRRVVVHVDDSG